jgi:hypothetical protein
MTATAWSRTGADRRRRAVVIAGVCALAGVAWSLHPDPSILTTEHLFAFFIGCAVASWRQLAAAARTSSATLRAGLSAGATS